MVGKKVKTRWCTPERILGVKVRTDMEGVCVCVYDFLKIKIPQAVPL